MDMGSNTFRQRGDNGPIPARHRDWTHDHKATGQTPRDHRGMLGSTQVGARFGFRAVVILLAAIVVVGIGIGLILSGALATMLN